jgi:uncharacterized damage-inducible protein DinB
VAVSSGVRAWTALLGGRATARHSREDVMADSRQLRRLVAYNQWADERILAAVDGVPAEELDRPREAYFGTIAANLRHIVMAQRIWLARWSGEAPRYDEQITVPWKAAFGETHAILRTYVGGLSDADADRPVRYTDLRGNAREIQLAQVITHLVNHGTAHRAETGLLLERLGRSPGDIDYSVYCFQNP